MFHAVLPAVASATSSASGVLRKRKASDVECSIQSSHTRLRNSLAANADPCSPDDNGKFKAKPALDACSPSNAKRRRSVGTASGGHENIAPAVDESQQGSSGYVPLVTSFFSNVISFATSLFSASSEGGSVAPDVAAPSAKATRTVVQTKAFTLTPGDLIHETPAR
jgi:hypothetical protein